MKKGKPETLNRPVASKPAPVAKKDNRGIITEYLSSLTEHDLAFLGYRLLERRGGDLGEALIMMSRRPSMDHLLAVNGSCLELYDTIDQIRDLAVKEMSKRNMYRG